MADAALIQRIQDSLTKAGAPAWLFYGFHEVDPIAIRILGFGPDYHCTRRWFYLVPAQGTPHKLVHRIESGNLDHLPGDKTVYLTWRELDEGLRDLLKDHPRVTMQYSGIPSISRVDGGTIDKVKACGAQVESSENLVQEFEAVWTPQQVEGHRSAAQMLTQAVKDAYALTANRLSSNEPITETDIQDFILDRFKSEGYVTDSPPIVGVDSHAGNPHHAASRDNDRRVTRNSFLLIDLWAKLDRPGSVFADITFTGYFGRPVPARIQEVFSVVTAARDKGVELLEERFRAGRHTEGWEVDDAVRQVIVDAGYGDDFVHRTGHNLGEEVHGNGVNFDNLETHDTRKVIPGTACTIEPGVYLPEFGVRSEINLYMGDQGPEVTTPPQTELLVLDV